MLGKKLGGAEGRKRKQESFRSSTVRDALIEHFWRNPSFADNSYTSSNYGQPIQCVVGLNQNEINSIQLEEAGIIYMYIALLDVTVDKSEITREIAFEVDGRDDNLADVDANTPTEVARSTILAVIEMHDVGFLKFEQNKCCDNFSSYLSPQFFLYITDYLLN